MKTSHLLPATLEPDLSVARAYLERVGPPMDRVLLCAVTGAHHYGFPSPDSDLDIKGIHIASTRTLLGLKPELAAIDRTEDFQGIECDLTTNEAGQALRLLMGGNGNMLERVFSPYQLVETAALTDLRALASAYVSRAFAAHYLGFGRGVRREYRKGAQPSVKALLYIYRVALTGVHLMKTGEVRANVVLNALDYGFPAVLPLVERKRTGEEKGVIAAAEAAKHEAQWERLDELLLAARDGSMLPVTAAEPERLSRWLIERRIQELDLAASL